MKNIVIFLEFIRSWVLQKYRTRSKKKFKSTVSLSFYIPINVHAVNNLFMNIDSPCSRNSCFERILLIFGRNFFTNFFTIRTFMFFQQMISNYYTFYVNKTHSKCFKILEFNFFKLVLIATVLHINFFNSLHNHYGVYKKLFKFCILNSSDMKELYFEISA